MSYKRIQAFGLWLANKWFRNLIHFPLVFHRESVEDGMKNVLFHVIWAWVTGLLVFIFSVREPNSTIYLVSHYWLIAFAVIAIHFIVCIIKRQYQKYISEMDQTISRLKNE